MITSGLGAGTPDRGTTTWQHLVYDALPQYFCGCHRDGDENECARFHNRRPPSLGSSDPARWRPATTFGDPHFFTLDGGNYTFNGVGEYILVQTTGVDDEDFFTLQIRTKPISLYASQIQAVAIATKTGLRAGFYLFDSNLIDIRVDDEIIEHNRDSDSVFLDGIALEISRLNASVTIRAQLINGVIVEVFSEGAALGVTASLPGRFQGKLEGLLGNWNGDLADDLMPRGGERPLRWTHTSKEIHNEFGMTWQIRQVESAFYYRLGSNVTTFADPDFDPFWSRGWSSNQFMMAAQEACAGSPIEKLCLYDARTSNTLVMPKESLRVYNQFATLEQQANLGPQATNNPHTELTARQGQEYTYDFAFKDLEGDQFQLDLLTSASDASLTATGVFTWKVPNDWPVSVTSFEIVGSDARGAKGGILFSVRVTAPETGTTSDALSLPLQLLLVLIITLSCVM